jgi:hypothetical protein
MWQSNLIVAVIIAVTFATPRQSSEVTGQYVEVRNCDVWTGPCFANAEGNLIGKNAALVWRVGSGAVDDVRLDGLSVVAVIQATDTLGARQSGPSKAVLIVDKRATPAQQRALVKLARLQGGDLVNDVIATHQAAISVNVCGCSGDGCAEIDAGVVKIKTRCLDAKHDAHCGNETAYYPPLTAGVQCVPAMAEHSYDGEGLSATWHEFERRGAYVGTFTIR